MGRTGRNFAVEHSAIAPDILITAKGLSSGYAPLGAVIASKKVVDAIAEGTGAFLHGFTYNAHPVSLAAGRAVLRHIQDNDLVDTANDSRSGSVGAQFKKALQSLLQANSVGDVRGIGLLWAVDSLPIRRRSSPILRREISPGWSRQRQWNGAFSSIPCRAAWTAFKAITSFSPRPP